MNRRLMLCSLLLLALPTVGCENLSFLPQAREHKVTGYDAVRAGMTEADVRRHMGEPRQRKGFNLEGTRKLAIGLTYVGGGKLMTVTLADGKVIGKERH